MSGRSGQARAVSCAKPRARYIAKAARKRRRAAVKYIILSVLGVLLYRAAAAYALTERGYKAIGGEIFLLLLPLIYYAMAKTGKDMIRDFKQAIKNDWEGFTDETTSRD